MTIKKWSFLILLDLNMKPLTELTKSSYSVNTTNFKCNLSGKTSRQDNVEPIRVLPIIYQPILQSYESSNYRNRGA